MEHHFEVGPVERDISFVLVLGEIGWSSPEGCRGSAQVRRGRKRDWSTVQSSGRCKQLVDVLLLVRGLSERAVRGGWRQACEWSKREGGAGRPLALRAKSKDSLPCS